MKKQKYSWGSSPNSVYPASAIRPMPKLLTSVATSGTRETLAATLRAYLKLLKYFIKR